METDKINERILQVTGKMTISPEDAMVLIKAYEQEKDVVITISAGLVLSMLKKTHKDGKDDHLLQAKAINLLSLSACV